jgi:IS5 family transposase
MKLHRGADRHGLIPTVRATAAGVADITQLLELPRGQARELFGHQAYWKEDDRQLLESWEIRKYVIGVSGGRSPSDRSASAGE